VISRYPINARKINRIEERKELCLCKPQVQEGLSEPDWGEGFKLFHKLYFALSKLLSFCPCLVIDCSFYGELFKVRKGRAEARYNAQTS
jgi:hypothetical protein